MDYEKEYKEALEKAKGLIDFCSDSELKTLENVFPELRESEDERIRKELLAYCKNRAEIYPNDPKYKNISAWIAWLEKQGEQKPAEWSEEDETALGDALWCCKQAASIAKNENDMGNVWYAETWLKSLKERIGGLTDFDVIGEVVQRNLLEEVVKQMSDALLVETLLYRKKQGTLSIFYDERKEELERFLKSICTWKPSEGQLECLGYAIEKAEKDWSPLTNNRIYLTLKALKEQLEKI